MKQEIVWQGDQREIPGVGVLAKGDRVKVPDHVAKSLIYQGLATKSKSKAVKEKDK